MNKVFSIFALLFATLVIGNAQTIDPNKTVATINGEPISASEYYRKMEFMSGVGTVSNNRFAESPPAFIALERLINEKFILIVAKNKGVAPTAGEVENELKKRKAEAPEQYQKMADLGMTDAEFRAQITLELAQFNLITMGVNITDQQIQEHYNTNKFSYTTPAKVKLRVIVVDSIANREKVDVALKTKDFSVVARESSLDLTKFDGGNLPEVDISRLPNNVLNQVQITAAGSTTAWIESGGLFSKYKVETKTEAKQLPLDDKLKLIIKRTLMLEFGESKNNVRAMLDEIRKSAKVQISAVGLQKLWDTYMQDYLRQIGGG